MWKMSMTWNANEKVFYLFQLNKWTEVKEKHCMFAIRLHTKVQSMKIECKNGKKVINQYSVIM